MIIAGHVIKYIDILIFDFDFHQHFQSSHNEVLCVLGPSLPISTHWFFF